MKHSDVQRIIENLENALRVHPDKGYEIGSLEESQKFAEERKLDLEKFPVSRGSSEKKFRNP
jgi:hypothetical protein